MLKLQEQYNDPVRFSPERTRNNTNVHTHENRNPLIKLYETHYYMQADNLTAPLTLQADNLTPIVSVVPPGTNGTGYRELHLFSGKTVFAVENRGTGRDCPEFYQPVHPCRRNNPVL